MGGRHFTDKDLERILKESRFTSKKHKASLWERLMSGAVTREKAGGFSVAELPEDALAQAAGGVRGTADRADVEDKDRGNPRI